MKKMIFLLACLFSVQTMVLADNEKAIQIGQLPAKAQTFISTYFKKHKVALAKVETDLFYKSYDVVFTNGEKLEFDKSGLLAIRSGSTRYLQSPMRPPAHSASAQKAA